MSWRHKEMNGALARLRWLVLGGALIGAIGGAEAARRTHAPVPPEQACARVGPRTVVVSRVTDGDTFIASDGTEIDLAGVMAPGSGGERVTLAQADAARNALQSALIATPVTIAAGAPDRYGRLKAQVFANGEWVQARMLNEGLVHAAPDLASAPCTPALLAIEKRTREAKVGHWGDGLFVVRSPDDLFRVTGTYQIVEGVVVSANEVKGRVYLDFGADWKTDFTATIATEDKAAFRKPRVDWKALAGKRVRVRGWIESYNGPMISLHAQGEIEFIDEMPKPVRVAHAATRAVADPPAPKPRKPHKARKPHKPAVFSPF